MSTSHVKRQQNLPDRKCIGRKPKNLILGEKGVYDIPHEVRKRNEFSRGWEVGRGCHGGTGGTALGSIYHAYLIVPWGILYSTLLIAAGCSWALVKGRAL